jgi:hypothetical protein
MAHRQMHLNRSGGGMAARTACGRNILRTPLSCDWDEFKTEVFQCLKCAESSFAAFRFRKDVEAWEPEDQDAWKKADDDLIAARL